MFETQLVARPDLDAAVGTPVAPGIRARLGVEQGTAQFTPRRGMLPAAYRADPFFEERAGDHVVGDREIVAANRQIDAFTREGDGAAGGDQLQIAFFPHRLLQTGQTRDQPADQKGRLAGDHQRAILMMPTGAVDRRLQVVQPPADLARQLLRLRHRVHHAAGALKQRESQGLLEFAHRAADGAVGDVERFGGFRHAAVPHRSFESPQYRQVRQSSLTHCAPF